jgi:PAS domain-containing protein
MDDYQRGKRVLATIGFGPMEPVLECSLKTFRPFAARHGYDLVIGDGYSAGRPPAWGKILLMARLLDSYDTVLWIDSDAIILDSSVDPATLVPDHAFQALAFHRLPQGQVAPNCGVWLIRESRGKEFLDRIWASEQFINHPIWENGAACELLGYSVNPYHRVASSEWMDGTDVLDDEWNRHWQLVGRQPGRIRHYAGMSNEFRRRRMLIDLDDMNNRRLSGKIRRVDWRLRGRRLAARSAGSRA